ncbi:MAG: sortase [Chloroflexota bacterium]|jgi:LPXTG-site transpeptidase (sortase) family protein|nr:sortase [Chloroflexota bacterium]
MVRRRWPILAIVLGLLLAGYGGLRLAQRGQGPSGAQSTNDLPAPIGIISPHPAASPTPAGYRVKVDELKIDLPVVLGDGKVPPLFVAAEEPGMKKPGQGGRSMLYAHARSGMFGPLRNARVGQHVEVTTADGRVLKYAISQVLLKVPANQLSWLEQVNHEQLLLETCTTYNPNDPRIIIVAEPA